MTLHDTLLEATTMSFFQSQTLSTMSCWYPMDTMCFILGEKATQATPYLWPSISAT